MRRHKLIHLARRSRGVLMAFLVATMAGHSQEPAPGASPAQVTPLVDSLRDLKAQVQDLGSALLQMRSEMARSRAEALQLRQELQETRERLSSMDHELKEFHLRETAPITATAASGASSGAAAQPSEKAGQEGLAKLKEDQQLLSERVDEQYQTKVESASKYRVRLSGIALLNIFGNRGSVDNQDLPTLARPRGPLESGGNFGATIRQSSLGLEIFGPKLGEAKTSGEMQFDFFGGFPNTLDGVTAGLVRLRIAKVRLDWQRTSIVAGQDTPFFSPLSPTSLASLALPAFAYSGNLWTWTPQVRVERRLDLSDTSSVLIQGGILDPLTGQPPADSFYRSPQAGESAGQPAYATRIAWTNGALGRPLTVGAGGYYARQNWGFGRTVDAWAGMADWDLPLGRWLSLTGEFYRGRALGGLGASVGRSVLFSGPPMLASSSVLGLNSAGGWAQLKFRPTEKLEFNGAFGEDTSLASDLNRFAQSQSYVDPSLARNQSTLVNSIYRLRSNLLFSVEYRRLRTSEVYAARNTADHLNVGVGVLF